MLVVVASAGGLGFAGWQLGWIGSRNATSTVAAPAGGEPPSWSATIVRTFETAGHSTVSTSHFARDGERSRLEWTEGERRFALIIRPDLGLQWLVDLSANSYSESAIGATGTAANATGAEPLTADQIEAAVSAGAPADGFVGRRERIGEATVEGHACVVYRSRLESLDGTASEASVWEAKDFAGLAIRSEVRSTSGNVVRTEIQGLSPNPQPGAFELPPGARKTGQTP